MTGSLPGGNDRLPLAAVLLTALALAFIPCSCMLLGLGQLFINQSLNDPFLYI
jgi:hypothetical protein